MPAYVALLRAINVTGRYIKMPVLAEAFRGLGYEAVRPYLQSGNVIFHAPERTAAQVASALEADLPARIGFAVDVFVRTAPQIQAIAAHAVALQGRVAVGGEVNVCFVAQTLTPDHRASLAALRSERDDFDIHDHEIYWLCQTRQSASTVSNAVLERRLRLRTTVRRARMLAGLAHEVE